MSHEATDAEEFEIDLDLLTDEELVEFEAALAADYEEKRGSEELGAEDVDELKSIVEVLTSVRAAMDERIELAEADEKAASVKGADFLAKVAARREAAEAKAAAEAAASDEAKAKADADAAEAKAAAEAEEAAAAAAAIEPVAKAAAAAEAKVVISPTGLAGDKVDAKGTGIVAAAATRDFKVGQEIPDFAAVAKTFVEARREAVSSGRDGDGSRFLVASVYGDYDESRTLGGDLERNMSKIDAVASVAAITASGGICAPNTPYYTLTTYGDAHRPVRDSFPVFKADRGGIRFMPAPQITDLAGSVRRTTAAQDAAGYTNQTPAGTTAPKPCLHVTCESEQSCIIQAVSRCLTFGNMGARTYPEQVEAWIKLGMAEFSRYAETELLNAVSAASTAVSAGQILGATYSLLDQISLVTTSFRARHRLSSDRVLRALFPFWTTEIIRADIAAQDAAGGLARYNVSDAEIVGWFRTRGVDPVFYQDNTTAAGAPFAAQSTGGLISWPNTVEWFIFPEGSFLYLDGGNLDLGLVRDSTLNSQNDYQIFYEEFFGLCFIGLESYKITSALCPNGVTSGALSTINGVPRACVSPGS